MLTDQTFTDPHWLLLTEELFVWDKAKPPAGANIRTHLVHYMNVSDNWRVFFRPIVLRHVYAEPDYTELLRVLRDLGLRSVLAIDAVMFKLPKRSMKGYIAYTPGLDFTNDCSRLFDPEEFVFTLTDVCRRAANFDHILQMMKYDGP